MKTGLLEKNKEIINEYYEKVFKFAYDKRVIKLLTNQSHRENVTL